MTELAICKCCTRPHTNFGSDIGVCWGCERKALEQKQGAEWAAKTPEQQALHYLESWANPSHMTFNRENAEFVLQVFRKLIKESK